MSGRIWRSAGLVLALLWLPVAQADVWGYVDDSGVAHLASEQLDNRYELYFSDRAPDEGRASRAGPVPMTPARLLAFFEVSPDFKRVRHLLREAARQHGIDYELLQAVIAAESGFDARAVSPAGAVGLMQVMPATARAYGVTDSRHRPVARKLTDPRINIRTGSRHLQYLMARFPDRLDLALAAYNAGLGTVRRAGNRIPPIAETRNYVRTVLQLYAMLKPPVPLPDDAPADRLAGLESRFESGVAAGATQSN